jgi:hypothetical protein
LERPGEEVGFVPRQGSPRNRKKLSAVLLHAHIYNADTIAQVRAECENTGEELPSYVSDAPVLRFGVALYYNAWFELDLERDRARLQVIKRSSVFEYCRDYDLTELQTDDMWFYISRMDHEFLGWYATQLKASSDGDANRPSD